MWDNYDLFLEHEDEQAAWLEKRPVCACCGEHIQDDYQYVINGESYCEECVNEQFRSEIE